MASSEIVRRGEQQLRSGTALELRLAQRVPLHPVLQGLIVAAALFGTFLLLCVWLEVPIRYDGHGFGHFIIEHGRSILLISTLMGFLVAALRLETRGRRADLVALGRLAEDEALLAPAAVLRQARWIGFAGAAAGVGLVSVLLVVHGGRVGESVWDVAATPWTVAVTPLFLGLLARSAFFLWAGIRDAVPSGDVDLLRLERLRPVGRIALRGALFWIVGLSLGALLYVSTGLSLLLLPFLAATAATAVATLLLPLRGLRHAIRRSKARELARTDALVNAAHEAALSGSTGAQDRLGNLAAWRSYVESRPEWPFDTSTWIRFALYLLIPLGSWIGGALVERLVDLLLSR